LGLVATGAIADEVITQLGDTLTAEERRPANLLEMVEASLGSADGTRSDSDLVRITVTADEPEKAAAIANAWAYIYVREVNTIYGQVPNEVLASIQNELSAAQKQYLDSQTNLETFIAGNRIDALNSQVAVLQQRVEQEVSLQKAFLLQWEDTQEQISTVAALRTQIEQGGEGAARSTMVALQTLKMNVYGSPLEGLQVEVRDLPDVNQQAMLTDLEGLRQALDQRLVDLNTKIGASNTDLGASQGVTSTLTSTLESLRTSKAELEAETAKQLQLTQQRDLAWETYKTVSSKVAELNLTRAAASSEVRFGAPAVAAINSVERISLGLGTGISGVLGLFLAILYVFLANYLGKTPLKRVIR
jgi:capsular polysaccharide biosynthesis protein